MPDIKSHHFFLFPFRFDKILKTLSDRHEFYKNYTFDERVTKSINNDFKNFLEKSDWEYQKFEIKNSLDYNELVYFYDFVKDTLFNMQDFQENATSYFFEKKIKDNAKYIICKNNYRWDKKLNKDVKIGETIYELDLCGITLRIFDTGVAILSFEVENKKYNSLEDIFNINEYGRRIYPQFLGENFSFEKTKSSFLAESLEVNGIKEDFNKDYKKGIKLANFITQTLGDTFVETINDKNNKDKFLIQPILDDRMYVISHILNNGFSSKVKDSINDNWYEYLFIDKYNGKTVQNVNMQNDLVKKSTYYRWQGYGTLYGVSRYSFVVLTDSGDFSQLIVNHVKTIYFQMVTLALAQRASILRFSDEITAISDIKPDKDTPEKISNIYKNYLRFKNKLYFKEITPQEQGIELYDLIRKNMRIDNDIYDLSTEISSLNNYAFVLEEKEEKEQMNKLTKIGTYLIPPALVTGFLGMNVFGNKIESNTWIVIAIIATIASPFIVKFLIANKEQR